ncbi:hypothetical protein GGH12_000139 [Coemansia sp. RSA 1822]|nr:hypothetical protein LPJ76_000139 [Coemansia sp. RSA 638]KAJ2545919.1 hypothetical protein GGF49_000122 [Coemansia sp. RSA 1853]KAJ2567701.1 hypothetical protein GGH12_000139 [Coemansia sp. RSA 1822]
MLAIAAARNLRKSVAESAVLGVNRIGKAAYQTNSSHGRSMYGKSKWVSRLLAYLQSGLGAVKQKSIKSVFSGTAAGRLRAVMPRGPSWLRGLSAKASLATQQTAARTGYIRSISQRLAGLLSSASAGSRLAGARAGSGRFAFERGGKWSPYMKIFAQNLRNLSSRGSATSAQVIMAQIRRQAMMGCMTEQRKGLAIALPRSQKVQAQLLEPGLQHADQSSAAAKLATGSRDISDNKSAALSNDTRSALAVDVEAQLHSAVKTAQELAALADQCVTITIPYALPSTLGKLAENTQASSADVAHLLVDMHKIQSRHTLLLTRLIERVSATGWNVQYQQIKGHTECIEIAIPPSSGIIKASDLDSILCSWGFDMSLIAAVICDPRVPPASSDVAAKEKSHTRTATTNSEASATSLLDLEDLDSRMFSLIVDEVVDPEEAYCEQVRDFLDDLESMPRLSAPKSMPPAYLFDAAKSAYFL